MSEKRNRLWQGLFFLLIFAFLFIWFSKIHALVVFDADDWSYLAYVRKTTPVWGEWNPAKVFPEVIFPFISTIAAWVLTPITGDYITAQTLMHAFVVSLSITMYLWCFFSLLRRCFPVSRLSASLITALFLLFHFLALRSQESGNQYLFYCVDLNCYYNYLLPCLLNASLVMGLTKNEKLHRFLTEGAPAARGCFYVVVYFAIFSNLPASGILAAYAGSVVLLGLIRRWKGRCWKRFLPENAFPIGVLAAWFISAVFELSGGRAASAGGGASLYYQVYLTCKYLAGILLDCNRLFQVSVLVIAVGFFVCLFLDRKKHPLDPALVSLLMTVVIACAAYGVYLVLLCAVVGPGTIYRSENLFGLFFLGTLIVLLMLAHLISRYPKLMLVLPLLVVFLLSGVDTREPTFLESNFGKLRPEVCADISRDLIQQMQEADEAGLSEVVLRLPAYVADPETQDNWPHSLSLMERLPGTLYSHGLISREIQVIPVADTAKNEQFHLPIPTK